MSRYAACLICLAWFLSGCVAPALSRPEPPVLQAVGQAVTVQQTPTPIPTM